MTRQRRLICAFLWGLFLATACAQDNPDPERFAEEIAAFRAADAEKMPEPGGILFVGSSSIRMWEDLEAAFPGYPIVRRGFGGSEFSDLLYFADQIVFPYEPLSIVVYEGDNDLSRGKSVAQVYGDYREFVGRVRERLPQTRVAFIAVKPSVARWALADSIRTLNGLIHAQAKRDPMLDYIDIWTPMLSSTGLPRASLFLDDGLHLNAAGYQVWRRAIEPVLAGP